MTMNKAGTTIAILATVVALLFPYSRFENRADAHAASAVVTASHSLAPSILGQTQTTPVSMNATISWTPPKLNADGSQLVDLKGFLFSVVPDDVDLTVPGTPAIQTMKIEGLELPACPGDLCEVAGSELFTGIGSGAFRVWAQAYDHAGNLSKYSLPSDAFTLDAIAPNAPAAVKVNVRVIVEVKVGGGG